MTTVSDGELAQVRRNIHENVGSYDEATRALVSTTKDPLAFLADENIRFRNLMKEDVMKTVAYCMFKGEKFNPENYYDSNPIVYRKSHPKFKTSSRDGYFVGCDFLTNQPIFRPYE